MLPLLLPEYVTLPFGIQHVQPTIWPQFPNDDNHRNLNHFLICIYDLRRAIQISPPIPARHRDSSYYGASWIPFSRSSPCTSRIWFYPMKRTFLVCSGRRMIKFLKPNGRSSRAYDGSHRYRFWSFYRYIAFFLLLPSRSNLASPLTEP